jgi:hypothetical protein
MKNVKRYLIKGMLALAVGVLLVMVAGCDYGYDWDYGGAVYSGPNRGSYYYAPYSNFSYGWYGYRSLYRGYGRGFGGRGFYGRRCR